MHHEFSQRAVDIFYSSRVQLQETFSTIYLLTTLDSARTPKETILTGTPPLELTTLLISN